MNLGRRLWSLRNKSNNRLPGRGSDHMFLARLFNALSLPELFTCGRALRRGATKKAHISCKSLGNDKALKRRAKVNRRWRGGSGSGNFCKADHLKLNKREDALYMELAISDFVLDASCQKNEPLRAG
jgi:hypothetical protein